MLNDIDKFMLLHWDDLVKLDYGTAQDILFVDVLDKEEINASELKFIYSCIIACIKEHKIENILLDLSKTKLVLKEDEFKAALALFAAGLTSSATLKLARIATKYPERENIVALLYKEILQVLKSKLEFRNFINRAEALHWLTGMPQREESSNT